MSNELKFNIAADSSRAVAAFSKVGDAAKKTKKEIKDLSETSSPAKQWKAADKAVAAYSRELDRAAKKQEKLSHSTSKWRTRLAQGLKLGAVGLAAGGVALGVAGIRAAAERESVANRLGGSLGDMDAGKKISAGLADWGARNNADPNDLILHVDKLVKAGISADSAVEAVKSAVVAAAGDVGKLEGIIEPLTEFASKGFIEEQLLDKFAELGVDLRAGLQEQLGLTREQLDKAVTDHTVSADSAIAAMKKLTEEGTKLHDSHAAALSGMGGSLASLSRQFDELKIGIGQGFSEGFGGTLSKLAEDLGVGLKDIANMLSGTAYMLGSAFAAVLGSLEWASKKIIEVLKALGVDVPNAAQKNIVLDYGHNYTAPEAEEKTASAARRKAASQLAAQRIAARAPEKKAELNKVLEDLATAQGSSPRSRAHIAADAGLGSASAVSVGDLDNMLAALNLAEVSRINSRQKKLESYLDELANFGLAENSTAADFEARRAELVTAGDEGAADDLALLESKIRTLGASAGVSSGALPDIVEGIRSATSSASATAEKAVTLTKLRDELKILEEEEKKVAEITADYERRMAIQDALLAGDKERADLLTQQAEAEKLANQYASQGIDLATAQAMAANEIAKKNAKPAEKTVFDPTAANVKLRETISSPLANIGGGGVRIRFYENQQLRAATDTASHTADIATVASQILTHLQTKSQTAILA